MITQTHPDRQPLIPYQHADQRGAALLATDAIEQALGGTDEVHEALADGCIRMTDERGWDGCIITGPEGHEVTIARDDNRIEIFAFTPTGRRGNPTLIWDARFSEKTPANVIATAIADAILGE